MSSEYADERDRERRPATEEAEADESCRRFPPPAFPMKSSPKLLLVILDGWGIARPGRHNAIVRANPRFFSSLWKTNPHAVLDASGPAVGLLPNQIGSSEVGHMHLGAGRVVLQELTRLHRSLADGSFYKNRALVAAVDRAKKKGVRLHLVGLLSDGGVHSHEQHLVALLRLAKQRGMREVFIHAILDGRDVAPASAGRYLKRLQIAMRRLGVGRLATLCGRHWMMDRNRHWQRTTRSLKLLTRGVADHARSWNEALQSQYRREITDEFLEPFLLDETGLIRNRDAVIFTNFRADRMRQIVESLSRKLPAAHLTTMIPYGVSIKTEIAFDRTVVPEHFSEVISRAGLRQVKIGESQKYAHITYFFNGTRERAYRDERRILVPSKHVENFAKAPEMSAKAITDAAEKNLKTCDVMVINYANADMVGHTGNITATTHAIRCLNRELARLIPMARTHGYDILITADHGNAEQMYDRTSNASHTAHTRNPVPLILVSGRSMKLKKRGTLPMVAPLMLELLGLPVPKLMGPSLQRK